MKLFQQRAIQHENPIRPWHDAQAIAHTRAVTRANQEKGGLGGRRKARPKVKLRLG